MAKIRVYELARDLNLKNKELLDKLEELDITVRSHMSFLNDDTVDKIKLSMRQENRQEKPPVELTRVKPTTIRRIKRATVDEEYPAKIIKLPSSQKEKDGTKTSSKNGDNLLPNSKLEKEFNDAKTDNQKEDELTIESVHKEIKEFKSFMEKEINTINAQLSILKSKARKPEILRKIQNRIKNAQVIGKDLQPQQYTSDISPSRLVKELRKRGFYLSEEKSEEIIRKIHLNKIIILNGVPGTGKSCLAKHLSEILLGKDKGAYSFISCNPEADIWDCIGGGKITDDNWKIPHFGWISSAILTSIENDGKHWLILDEINRCDISRLFSPILDALSPDNDGYIDHPFLYPEKENETGKIPIPGSFRIIGTMNPFEQDLLFDFADALVRRTGFVSIPPLKDDDERDFLYNHLLVKMLNLKNIKTDDGEYIKILIERHKIKIALSFFLNIVEKIRGIAKRQPKDQFQHCEIGTATIIKAAKLIFSQCLDSPPKNESEAFLLVDRSISESVLEGFEKTPSLVIDHLLNEVLDEERTPESYMKLKNILM